MPKPKRLACQQCGAPCRFKFCSKRCYGDAKIRSSRRICRTCSRPFVARASAIARGEGNFCSLKCSSRFHNPPTPMHERFYQHYQPADPSACWPWTGTRDRDGYGVIQGENRRQLRAHRIAYELAHGPIPAGRQVLHTCDNPPCCNPSHLKVGTADENNKDKAQKLRANAKLTPDDVRQVRALHAEGVSALKIASRLGVSYGAIYPILRRRNWTHVV